MFLRFLDSISRMTRPRFKKRSRRTKRNHRHLELESLDCRYAMAGDVMSLAEGEAAPDLVAFAKLLAADNLKLYGADWTQETTNQLSLFEDGARYLNYVEAFNGNRTQNAIGIEKNITAVPTWISGNGDRVEAFLTLDELSRGTGIPIPRSSTPSFFPIEPQTILTNSPLHIPIDAYDPNGNPLTFTVTSSQPSNVTVEILENNQSARVAVDGYGEMIFELFNTDAPRPVNRFVTLAQSGFYNTTATNEMTFHRAASDFVIQGGDPTATGRGGSTLGNFDDQFNLNLQHNRSGVLSYAKTFDDTNDSQFFVTAQATRFLDYNHSIFGQLIEGDRTRAGINRIAVDANQTPLAKVVIRKVEIFNDTENGLLRLVAKGAPGSTSEITVTVKDNEGNLFSQTFTVTVAEDTANGAPFFGNIPLGHATTNNAVTLHLNAIDQEGDAPWYSVSLVGTAPQIQAQFNSSTGDVLITPNTDFVGKADLQVIVARAPLTALQIQTAIQNRDGTLFDYQIVSVQFDKPLTSFAINAGLTIEKGGVLTGTVTRPSLNTSSPLVIALTSSDDTKATVPASVTIAANQTTATFSITMVDNTTVNGVFRATITGTVMNNSESVGFDIIDDESPNPWNNAAEPNDVNNDGIVAPLDVLLIINQLSRLGVRLLPIPQSAVTFFVDADNDFFVSPTDVLRVINALNRRGTGEGEATTADSTHSSALSLWLTEETSALRNRRSRNS